MAARVMPLYLVPADRDDGPVPFDKPILFFGRHADCDVIITCSRRVSRRHCCVAQVGDGFLVRDLGSMNGIRVNGTRVRIQTSLKMGDELSVGDVRFRLKEGRYDVPKGKVTIGPSLDEVGDEVARRGKQASPSPGGGPKGKAAKELLKEERSGGRKPRPVEEFTNPDSEEIFLRDAAAAAPDRGSLDILPPEDLEAVEEDRSSDDLPKSMPLAEPDETPSADRPIADGTDDDLAGEADRDEPLPQPASSGEIIELSEFDLLD